MSPPYTSFTSGRGADPYFTLTPDTVNIECISKWFSGVLNLSGNDLLLVSLVGFAVLSTQIYSGLGDGSGKHSGLLLFT